MGLKVTLAGRVSMSADGVVIDEERFPGRQGRLVFAYLVSEHGRPVFREELADALWGEAPPARWEKALAVLASKLRALLGECGVDGTQALTNAFGCYRLDLPDGSLVDVRVAARAVSKAETALAAGDMAKAKAEASKASAVARLTLLPGEDGEWLEEKRRELAEVLARALGCLADACLRSGEASEAAKWAGEAIALEPYRESGYRLLMNAQAAAGNRAEALRTYERCRRLLADELGAYPSPETESIYRDLLSAAPAEARATAVAEEAPPQAVVEQPTAHRRFPAIAVAALVIAAAGAVLGFVLTQRGKSTTSVRANAVGVIDAQSGRIASQVPMEVAPTAAAASRDAVWITSSDGNSVSRIDPLKSSVRQTIPVGGGPAAVAVGGGAVWVANGLDGTVSRIDPTTNQVVLTTRVGNGPSGVAYGERALWVTNSADGTVSQIDPGTGTVQRTLPAVVGASGIAIGFGRVWIASPPSGNVVALDARSGRVLHRIGVGVEPAAIAISAGAVWVANRADDTVSRIDPRTAAVKSAIPVGRGPGGIAAGPGGVWVTNGAGRSLSRIDPSRGAVVKTVPLGNPPRGVTFSRERLYVAVQSTGSEHRGGSLRISSIFGVDSIDPALAPTPAGWPVLIMTNDGLAGFRRVGGVQGAQLVPDLAVSLPTPTESGKTYTFQVRPGIRYSNGRLVQPDDFKRALERLFEIGGLNAGYYGGIVGAARCVKGKSCDLSRGIVTDRAARTVTFHLTAPDADFLAKLALPPAFTVPAGTSADDVGTHPVPATGPYRIAEYNKKLKTVRLVRNRSFREWSADAQPAGYPDSISVSWPFGPDTTAQVGAVERGAAEVALGGVPSLPNPQLDRLAVRHPSQLHVNAQLGTTYFFLNTRVPPFDDVRVRRAVNDAFDRGAFARLLGPTFAPTCQILPPNFPGYRPTCRYVSGGVSGVDRARRLVRRSGTAGARVTVWVQSPVADQGRFMVSVLDSLGYRARLKAVDPHTYFDQVGDSRVRAQVGYYSWLAGYPSAADFIPPQLSCAAFAPASPAQNTNFSGFCSPAIDVQMARAAAAQTQDPAAATVLWQRVEQLLLARAPLVPAYNRSNVDFVSKRVGNYQYNPQWGLLLAQAWVK